MYWFTKCFQQYADFSGRARRKEYWMFALYNFIIGIVLAIIDRFLFGVDILIGIYDLAVLIPSLAVGVRRLHDIGKSGWWCLINLIPVIGQIIFIVFACMDSQPGENKWGENPKEYE